SVSTTDAIVSPGEYAVIVQDDKQFILDYPNFSGSIFDSSWSSLNESGEEIGLKDNAENFIEEFTYISASDYSLERGNPFLTDYTNVNWRENSTGNTVGFINTNFSTGTTTSPTPTADTSTLWSQIKINEFISDPTSGPEWIELYNTGTSSLDLAGGLLCDSRAGDCAIADTVGIIDAGGFLVINLSGSRLNNDGDSVILKNPSGEVIDQISYNSNQLSVKKGEAIARNSDGADTDGAADWSLTETPTMNASNIITAPPAASLPSAPAVGGGANPDYFTAILQPKTEKPTTTKKTSKDTTTIIWNVDYPTPISLNSSTLFDAHRSADPRGGEIFYTWDFGDGSAAEGSRVAHTFASSGIFTIQIRATSTGGTIGQKNFSVKVGTSDSLVFLKEILVKPDINEDESVTISTVSTGTINLSGWKIGTDNDRWFTIPLNTFLRPDGILRFFKTVTHLAFIDSGGSVILASPQGVVVDIMDYGKVKRGEVISGDPILENISATDVVPTSSQPTSSILSIEEASDKPAGSNLAVIGTVQTL
ncbi:MAG: lamin tail domain-containing protein, partial [Patescibacteria group bacterium]